ncbi:transcriptional repressor [Candidatus Gottesmanbacteria bacterium]|nr:transcriptional repressor [Candidatus Gottesmanbacteria bacterium]
MSENIYDKLKSSGFKLTRGRKSIINIFINKNRPLSAAEIMDSLHKSKIYLHKTTVYRELEFLLSQNIIRQLQFSDRKKIYEILSNDHHHHLVCKNCQKTEKVSSVALETNIQSLEEEILTHSNFKNVRHSLEFFGLCRQCQ